MPSIAHIANLWSLVGHPSPAKEWSLEKKIKAIAAAGFDGITTRVTPEHRRLAEKHGLRHILGFISTDDPTEFADRLREPLPSLGTPGLYTSALDGRQCDS